MIDDGPAKKIYAPFTPEQVDGLNEYQKSRAMHPFTCAHREGHPFEPEFGDHGVLRAKESGWHCEYCEYTQGWAWEFMSDPENFPRLPW